jgi:hypothetical protein
MTLHHYNNVEGPHKGIINTENIRGCCTYIRGNAQNLTGDVSGLHGDISGLSGDATNVTLYVSISVFTVIGDITGIDISISGSTIDPAVYS